MSGEKKRYRWNRNPIVIEENLIIDSRTNRTQTGQEQRQEHIENTIRRWYPPGDDQRSRINRRLDPANEKISEKIDRILRKIHAWTNDTTISDINASKNQPKTDQRCPSTRLTQENRSKRNSTFLDSFRRSCSSSTQNDRDQIDLHPLPVHRPFSMIFIDRTPARPTHSHVDQHQQVRK